MEDEEESPRMLPPVASSVESRMNRKKMPASTGNRGGRGGGRGFVPAKSTAPSTSISTDTNANMHLEPLAKVEDHNEDFDMNAEISVSVPTDDDVDDDPVTKEVGDDVSVPSSPSKATRGRKGKRSGVHLSSSKVKVKRGKRAGCWKYFKEIKVQSDKEFGVMVTKAKCRFCHKSYAYQQGGATSQLNRHLSRCTQFQNKLAKAKRILAQEPIEGLISDIRNTVKYFKRSPSRLYKFVQVCNDYAIQVGKCLSLDVKTRWNSTYKMLNTCIEYRSAFGYYAQVDQNYAWKPTDSEWDMYEKIRPILGEMAGATTAFSGSVYPTTNVFYPYILKVKLALLKAKNKEGPYLKNMGAAMLDKFNKYWEEKNNVMVIATILDPRFKMRYIEFYFRKLYGSSRCEQEVADIKKELEELYKKHELEQRRKMGGSSSSSTTQSASSSKKTTSSVACLVSSEFESFLEPSASETSKSELLIYLDEANHPLQDKNFNLLHYWKVNALRFPIVSSLAKKFLAVPASSVSSESTFSCGGRVLDDYNRSSLKPATVQALVCASSWIRGSKSPIILGEDADDGDIESVELPSSVVESN